eukprot:COSAG01_NODE_399_length_17543_cov_15.077792_2_plen_136_part_00
MATPKHTPEGRGYMSTLNYWSHKNDFWTMVSDQSGCADTVVDLWQANASAPAGSPAFHLVGTKYEEYLFRDEALSVLHAHPPSGEAPNGRPRPATDKKKTPRSLNERPTDTKLCLSRRFSLGGSPRPTAKTAPLN